MERTHARPLPYLCSMLYPVSFIQHWNFSFTLSFRPHYGPEVDVASNSNEYQEYFLGGKRQPVHSADNLSTFMC